jgi:hypothetical protein
MSKQNIQINYLWNAKIALDSSHELYQYEFKHSRKRFIGWFFIALVQFGVVGALKHNAYGFLTLGTIGVTYWYGFRWNIRKYFILRSFNKSPLANTKIILEATKDGLYKNEKIQLFYKDISKSEQLNNAIVIYHASGVIYIPNQAFQTSKERTIFKSYLNL